MRFHLAKTRKIKIRQTAPKILRPTPKAQTARTPEETNRRHKKTNQLRNRDRSVLRTFASESKKRLTELSKEQKNF